MLWKKINGKGNITMKYIKYKHKNTGTSCKSIGISRLQCFGSSTKYWKTVLKPSFELSVKINRFSRLVCFNWVCNKFFTSLILEKNLWTFDKLDVLKHKKYVLWEVATPKHTVYKKRIQERLHHFVIMFLRNIHYPCVRE